MTSIRSTLRKLAAEIDSVERERLADLLASQLEIEIDGQSDRAQVAIWMTEERWREKIGQIHVDIQETHTLVSAAIAGTKDVARELKLGVGNVIGHIQDLRALVRTLEIDYEALAARLEALAARDLAQFVESKQDRNDLRRILEGYIAQLPLDDRATLITYSSQVPQLRADIDTIAARVAALETTHGAADAP